MSARWRSRPWRRLKKAGYKVEIATHKKGVDNVVARMKGKGKGPVIAFNAHVDTVGVGERSNWRTDPFKAFVKGGLVYGLGAGNCKGSMAVQLWLAEEVARRGGPRKGELIFTFVADEENLGPEGMEFLRKSGKVRPDAVILGDADVPEHPQSPALFAARPGYVQLRAVLFNRAGQHQQVVRDAVARADVPGEPRLLREAQPLEQRHRCRGIGRHRRGQLGEAVRVRDGEQRLQQIAAQTLATPVGRHEPQGLHQLQVRLHHVLAAGLQDLPGDLRAGPLARGGGCGHAAILPHGESSDKKREHCS